MSKIEKILKLLYKQEAKTDKKEKKETISKHITELKKLHETISKELKDLSKKIDSQTYREEDFRKTLNNAINRIQKKTILRNAQRPDFSPLKIRTEKDLAQMHP